MAKKSKTGNAWADRKAESFFTGARAVVEAAAELDPKTSPTLAVQGCARARLRASDMYPNKPFDTARRLSPPGYGFNESKLRRFSNDVLACAAKVLDKPVKTVPETFPDAPTLNGTMGDLIAKLTKMATAK